MNLELANKTALVSGSTRGIGEAIARCLALEGVTVAVHGRSAERARDVAAEIEPLGTMTHWVAGDLAADEGADVVFSQAMEKMGRVDILINNAGSFEACSWENATPERWAHTYNSNVLSMVRLDRLAVPGMQERGWGRIVHIASISAVLASPVFPDYAAAKAATLNLTVSLMQETAGLGITVNTVSPGPVVTETWETFAKQVAQAQGWNGGLESVKEQLLSGIMSNPCGRLGEPEDVASMVAFIASPLAGYINGANLPVNGGLAARVHG